MPAQPLALYQWRNKWISWRVLHPIQPHTFMQIVLMKRYASHPNASLPVVCVNIFACERQCCNCEQAADRHTETEHPSISVIDFANVIMACSKKRKEKLIANIALSGQKSMQSFSPHDKFKSNVPYMLRVHSARQKCQCVVTQNTVISSKRILKTQCWEREKRNQFKAQYEKSTKVFVHSLTAQEHAMECSLRIAWILWKHKKPFTDRDGKRMYELSWWDLAWW